MRTWLRLVAVPPYPEGRTELTALAAEARRKLDAASRLLAEERTTARVLELAALLFRSPLSVDTLEDARKFFGWLWPNWANQDTRALDVVLGPTPPRAFHELITDGRPDLAFLRAGDDGKAASADHALSGEDVDAWVHLRHAGDGHQDLFWDQAHASGIRLLWTDNSVHDVIVDTWSAEQFLWERVFPSWIADCRAQIDALFNADPGASWKGSLLFAALFLVVFSGIGGCLYGLASCGGSSRPGHVGR